MGPPVETARLLGAVLLLVGAWLLRPFGNLENPANVPPFLGAAAVMSLGFLLALRCRSIGPFWFWTIAVGLRAVLFGMEPGSDISRYIWEGVIQNAGYSPYCHPPDSPVLAHLRNSIWNMVQHKEVSAIYPPLAQLIFRAVTSFSASVPAMKAVFVAADLAVCWLAFRRFGGRRTLVYAWNPLILYSFSGGGHYDSLFVLAITAAFLVWDGGDSPARRLGGVTLLGAGVALKWLSLPIFGWALWRVLRLDGHKRLFLALSAGAAPFGLAWIIVASGQ